jgi:hypothetical protein
MVESYSKICNYSTEYTLKSLGIVSSNVDLKIKKSIRRNNTVIMFIEEHLRTLIFFVSTSAKFIIST